MRPRLIRRKTLRSTRASEQRKPTQQKLNPGQVIKIMNGQFSGQKAEILKTTNEGVVVSVVEPFTEQHGKSVWIERVQVEGHPTRHRIILIQHGSLELYVPAKPQTQHGKMPLKNEN